MRKFLSYRNICCFSSFLLLHWLLFFHSTNVFLVLFLFVCVYYVQVHYYKGFITYLQGFYSNFHALKGRDCSELSVIWIPRVRYIFVKQWLRKSFIFITKLNMKQAPLSSGGCGCGEGQGIISCVQTQETCSIFHIGGQTSISQNTADTLTVLWVTQVSSLTTSWAQQALTAGVGSPVSFNP